MSQAELLIPAPDESAVVDKFIQASREIMPMVQISLARRFVTAGSDKVVCLAAHTSVPLSPDELASVSDLALQLSDGTNVRLSLSFVTDGPNIAPVRMPEPAPKAIEYVPIVRNIYDPQRYEVRNDSGLPTVITCMLLLGCSGAYWYFNNQSPLPKFLLKTAKVLPSKQKTIALATPAAYSKPLRETPERVERLPELKSQPVTVRPRSAHHAARAVTLPPAPYTPPAVTPFTVKREMGGTHAPRNAFIPPPPPMALPLSPGTMPSFDFGSFSLVPVQKGQQEKATVATPVAQAKPRMAAPAFVPVQPIETASVKAAPIYSISRAPQILPAAKSEEQPESRPINWDNVRQVDTQPFVGISTPTPGNIAAPIPGSFDSSGLNLERITPPSN